MPKFKRGLVQEYKQTQEEKVNQERLRHEHGIQDSSVVVVERNTSFISLLRLIGRTIQVIASILLVTLAAIGALSLLYPAPRAEMMVLFSQIWDHLTTLL